jgi:hypothetical protein
MRFSLYPVPETAGEYDEPRFDGEGVDVAVGAIAAAVVLGGLPGVRVRFPDGNPDHQAEEVLGAVTELLGTAEPPYEVTGSFSTKVQAQGGFVDLTIRAHRLDAEAAPTARY